MRERIEECAARIGGRKGSEPVDLPPELRGFVENVARAGFLVSDTDIEHLRHHGYGEDAIFEIVVCAALGAGSARFERARELLDDAP